MIKPFQFSGIPKIIFGNGEISRLPDLIKQYGSRIILVTGKNSFTAGSYFSALSESLRSGGVEFRQAGIPGEPSPDMIDAAVSGLSSFNAHAVVAIGGGSVMDAGKAISAMLKLGESVTDYLEDIGIKQHPGTKVPFIAVPTTAGTGSEATKNAVISCTGENGFKKSLRHDNFVPDIALVDPELTVSCPPDITAASGMDCFSQLTETYLSSKANEYTDALALEGLRAVKNSLLRSYSDGQDKEARAGMSFAALTSGICLANAGLGVVHGFASAVGGLYDIPHGLVCGTLMAASNEMSVRKLRSSGVNPGALKKYAVLGKLFLDAPGSPDDYYIDGFIDYLHELTLRLNIPGLKAAGVKDRDIPEICRNTGMKNNPVKLEAADLAIVLEKRFT